MIVLGIETSCDETAAAVVRDAPLPAGRILGEKLLSQWRDHQPFGGVVPEIAARAHVAHLDHVVRQAMRDAGVGFAELDGVAAAAGPGLIGGVLVGLVTAKAIALAANKPLMAVNHLEGHALTARLTDDVAFPYLLLLVSGGHCQLLAVEDVGRYVRLGTTIDDAAGEAFDKTAKLLGLDYPGGPAIERAAIGGDPRRFPLPRPMQGRPGCDFSFSGLKTAMRHHLAGIDGQPGTALGAADIADLAAGFQAAAVDAVIDRVAHAMIWFAGRHGGSRRAQGVTQLGHASHSDEGGSAAWRLVAAGGVAANTALRASLAELAKAKDFAFTVPPAALCTDNAAMIAWAGLERLKRGLCDGLDAPARARWPLDPDAEPRPYAGAKA
jgi:N6-L-threonylcarbamoyladenine synthase